MIGFAVFAIGQATDLFTEFGWFTDFLGAWGF